MKYFRDVSWEKSGIGIDKHKKSNKKELLTKLLLRHFIMIKFFVKGIVDSCINSL